MSAKFNAALDQETRYVNVSFLHGGVMTLPVRSGFEPLADRELGFGVPSAEVSQPAGAAAICLVMHPEQAEIEGLSH